MNCSEIIRKIESVMHACAGSWAFKITKRNPAKFRFLCEEGKLTFDTERMTVSVEFLGSELAVRSIATEDEIDAFVEAFPYRLQHWFVGKIKNEIVEKYPSVKRFEIVREKFYFNKLKKAADIYIYLMVNKRLVRVRYICTEKGYELKEAAYVSRDLSEVLELINAVTMFEMIESS